MGKTKKPEAVGSSLTISIPSHYPPDDVQEMAKAKGFTDVEAMLTFALDKQMTMYYERTRPKLEEG